MNSVKKIIALILALIMLATSLIACGARGKKLLKLDGESISVNLFELYLSRMKGTLCSAALFGSSAEKDEFWDTWMDVYDKKTYNTHYTEMVLEASKTYLCALALFEERGLKLSDDKIAQIDAKLDELVANEANGSKTAFNTIIGEYGVNYEMLKEAYIIDAKLELLQTDLFGADGSKIGENIIDDYYKDNYARFKHVFLRSYYEYQYVLDRNEDVMYFKENGKNIAYDTTKTQLLKDNGEPEVDENGDTVYVYTDDKGKTRIAYDTENGKPEVQKDGNGNVVTKEFNATEMAVLKEERDEILAQAKANDMLGFDVLVSKYNQDKDVENYPNGFYVTEETAHRSPEVIEKVFSMEVGAVDWVQTDYGIHIIMRCPLEDGAYMKSENKDIFISNETSTYIFMDSLKAELLTEYLAPYRERITVDEKVLATVDMKRAGVNFYY